MTDKDKVSNKRDVEECYICGVAITDENVGYRMRIVLCNPCANNNISELLDLNKRGTERLAFMMGVAQDLRNEHDELLSLVREAVVQLGSLPITSQSERCCHKNRGHIVRYHDDGREQVLFNLMEDHTDYCAYGKLIEYVEDSDDE